MNRKHSSLYSTGSSLLKDDFDDEDDKIIKPKTKKKQKLIGVQRSRIFALYKNKKFIIFLASLGSLCAGAVMPLAGFNLSNCINAFSSGEKGKIRRRGLLHSCMYLIIAVSAATFMFLKIRHFRIIGSFLECQMRKLVINKYLGMHMGFYDRDENAPGALLSRLSIDTTQLHCLI
jgi:ATP-binding cassette subfamily B (MDR/TAP) protein 1